MPPEGEAVQVADWPVVMEVGETEQEAEKSEPLIPTVTLFVSEPPGPVQVKVYV